MGQLVACACNEGGDRDALEREVALCSGDVLDVAVQDPHGHDLVLLRSNTLASVELLRRQVAVAEGLAPDKVSLLGPGNMSLAESSATLQSAGLEGPVAIVTLLPLFEAYTDLAQVAADDVAADSAWVDQALDEVGTELGVAQDGAGTSPHQVAALRSGDVPRGVGILRAGRGGATDKDSRPGSTADSDVELEDLDSHSTGKVPPAQAATPDILAAGNEEGDGGCAPERRSSQSIQVPMHSAQIAARSELEAMDGDSPSSRGRASPDSQTMASADKHGREIASEDEEAGLPTAGTVEALVSHLLPTVVGDAANSAVEAVLGSGSPEHAGEAGSDSAVESDADGYRIVDTGRLSTGTVANPRDMHVRFINDTARSVDLKWVGFQGRLRDHARLIPTEALTVEAREGHVWKLFVARTDRELVALELLDDGEVHLASILSLVEQ